MQGSPTLGAERLRDALGRLRQPEGAGAGGADRQLARAAAAMANAEGGCALLGVDDDGRIGGLHPHRKSAGLRAVVSDNTGGEFLRRQRRRLPEPPAFPHKRHCGDSA